MYFSWYVISPQESKKWFIQDKQNLRVSWNPHRGKVPHGNASINNWIKNVLHQIRNGIHKIKNIINMIRNAIHGIKKENEEYPKDEANKMKTIPKKTASKIETTSKLMSTQIMNTPVK